jgi:hypothetical protein
MLVLGVMSAGIALSKQINIIQAARETSRYASTLSFQAAGGDVDAWLAAVSNAADATAGPADAPIGGYDYRCVAYVEIGGLQRRIENSGPPQNDTCATPDSALGPAYVQVVLQRNTDFIALFINPTITLSASSVTPFEARP